MDYGKTAYLKTEELEARLDALAAPKRERSAYASTEPDREIKDGRTAELFAVCGEGVTVLNLKITATVYSAGTLALYLGDKRVGSAEFSVEGNVSETISAAVTVSGSAYLTLKPEDGFFGKIRRAETTVFGADASVIMPPYSLCADSDSLVTLALNGKNDRITAYLFSSVSGEKTSEKTIVGCGNLCDVVSDGDGKFSAVYRDGFGGVWGIKLSGAVITDRAYLFSGADGLALNKTATGYAIAFLSGGEIFLRFTDPDFGGCTKAAEVGFPYKAESVAFVKGAAKPTLIVYSGGKSFLKTAEDETAAYGAVTATLSFSATSA